MIELEDIRSGTGDHVVQFYERDADLVRTVGGYLVEGLRAGETVVVLATEEHRRSFGRQLEDAGFDVAAMAGGRLQWLDAAATLSQFCTGGDVDRGGFLAVIGDVLRQAAGYGRPIRAYGEMVALLWDEGYVAAAIEVEELWNELRCEIPTSLFCAYRNDSVSGSELEEALRDVCCLHSAVLDRDAQYWAAGLGPVEAMEAIREFEATPEAPRARRAVSWSTSYGCRVTPRPWWTTRPWSSPSWRPTRWCMPAQASR